MVAETGTDARLTVHNDTAVWYRYIDMTAQAEALFRFIDRTIDTELAAELAFLARYAAARKAIQEIVDLPDRQIDLFIRFCSQNDGRLSARKRASHFSLCRTKRSNRWSGRCSRVTATTRTVLPRTPSRSRSVRSEAVRHDDERPCRRGCVLDGTL